MQNEYSTKSVTLFGQHAEMIIGIDAQTVKNTYEQVSFYNFPHFFFSNYTLTN